MINVTRLSHSDALKIVMAVKQKFENENKRGAIAVTDENGELLVFFRTDNCILAAIQIAINKAFTAACDQKKTSVIGNAFLEFGVNTTYYGDLRYTGLGGGVPVIYDEKIIGAVGVSGFSQEEDEAVANFGIDSLEL
jgi:glc operon protein GlcG